MQPKLYNSVFVVTVLLFGFAGYLKPVCCYGGSTDTEFKHQFFEAVAEMEQKLANASFHCQVDGMDITRKRGAQEKSGRFQFEVAKLKKNILRKDLNHNDDAFQLSAKNDLYAYGLKSDSNHKSLLYLTQVGVSLADDMRIDVAVEDMAILNGPFAGFFYGLPLCEFVKSEGFSINRISEIESDGAQLVRLDFTFPKEVTPKIEVTDCYFVCNPKLGWAVIESGSTRKFIGGQVDVDVFKHEFGEIIREVPIARRIVSTLTRQGGGYDSESDFKIQVLSDAPTRDIFF